MWKKFEKYLPYILFLATVIGWIVTGVVNSKILRYELDQVKTSTTANKTKIDEIQKQTSKIDEIGTAVKAANTAAGKNTELIYDLNEQLKKQNILNGQMIMFLKLNGNLDLSDNSNP